MQRKFYGSLSGMVFCADDKCRLLLFSGEQDKHPFPFF